MGRIVPAPIIGQSAASGAQVIDGSLKFNRDGSTRLEKTFSTSGSASQFTWSYWVKRTKFVLDE